MSDAIDQRVTYYQPVIDISQSVRLIQKHNTILCEAVTMQNTRLNALQSQIAAIAKAEGSE